MDKQNNSLLVKLFGSSVTYMRKRLFNVLSMGPIPTHLAFILDGNRRYARKWGLGEGMGHRAGFLSLMTLMKYCYELGVKYITVYAFSIDNFRRKPEQVQNVMDLMQEKIEGLLREESIVNQYGVRVHFIGNLKLLSEPVRIAAEKAMKATSHNTRSILLVCVAYTSTDEIAHAAQESCLDKMEEVRAMVRAGDVPNGVADEEKKKDGVIKPVDFEEFRSLFRVGNGKIDGEKKMDDVIRLVDVERHMYMGIAPDPDILVRTSGETRLSNFLLWQTTNSLLYNPKALWPEIGLRHLVWAVLNFQRAHSYLEKRRKQV